MDEKQMREAAARIEAEWHMGGLTGGTIYEDFAVELAKRAIATERERCKARAAQIVEWHRNDYNRQQIDPIVAELRNGI